MSREGDPSLDFYNKFIIIISDDQEPPKYHRKERNDDLAIPFRIALCHLCLEVNLRDGDGISGHFFLGTGSIGIIQYYFFYKEVEQGYQPGKVAVADNVIIFEEKRQNGELKIYTYKFVNPSFRWVAMDWQNQKKYEFVIPEGGLKKNFVLQ